MEKLSKYNNLEIDGDLFSKDDILDLYRLQKQLLIEENIIATFQECSTIWGNYSADLSASWLIFPSDDSSILNQIRSSNFFTSFEEYAQ